ncbi:MAG: polysaccharide biosynthesis tyrosine autokinase [Gemmatimonadetes bacterium]|nr:polysaccharide biosynthesis tyrosine autokinase [Gemmatimonadota bacterium]
MSDLAAHLFDEAEGESKGPGFRRLLAAVVRYKWLVAGLMVLGTAAGLLLSRFVKPEYVADATVWIDGPQDRGGPIQGSELLQNTAWVDLLKSYTVLDYVVSTERLYLQYDVRDRALFQNFELASRFIPGGYEFQVDKSGRRYDLRSSTGQVVEQGAVTDSVGRRQGFRWVLPPKALKPGRTVKFTVSTPRDAARDLARRLRPTLADNANFLTIELAGDDPQRIASVVNTLIDRYVDVARDLKSGKQRELTKILADQLASAELNLHQAESELERFRVETITLPTEEGTPVTPGLESTRQQAVSSFFTMKLEKEELQRQRDAIQQVLRQRPDSGISVDALAAIDAVQKSPELSTALKELTEKRATLRALSQQFTPEHPRVKQLVADIARVETQTVPRLAEAVAADLARREASLDNLIKNASGDLRQIPPRAINEARLKRQVAVAENLYTMLQQRYEEARLAAESSTPDVRILDRAIVPNEPVTDKRISVILLGLLGGLGFAVALAILLDRIDPRVRYPEQVTGMKLAILGAVPHVKGSGDRLKPDEIAPVLEALRGIRLNLLHAYGSAGPLLLTITSPGSGDGKSFLSSNLALAFADLGYETLVIDGDIRRGELHRLLGVSRKPGLTDFLAGKATREEIVQPTSYPSLHVIGCGTRMQRGPELLGSPAMGQLLAHIRTKYRVILIDSPPLGAGVDPFILGTLTGHLLLVLRTGRTDRALAEAKLETVKSLPIRLLGAVLNGVEEGSVYRYHYYSYLPGYEAHEEGEEEEARLLQDA